MASMIRESNGRTRFQIFWSDGRRTSVAIGCVPLRTAEHFKVRIEALHAARRAGTSVDDETSLWLSKRDDRVYARLAEAGLVDPRKSAGPQRSNPLMTLSGLIAAYNAAKLKAKASTRKAWRDYQRNLTEFFGAPKDIGGITEADAEKWAEWLSANEKLSQATVRKRCGNAKTLFKFAGKSRLLTVNPFADLKGANTTNRSRDHFISRTDADVILEECPDAEWRLLFALSRYGGLRCPSEHLALKWSDIDWERDRMRVPSPKTEHHPGGESRMVPIFPELRPYLDECLDLYGEESEFVIARQRDAGSHLRNKLGRIILRAGLKPWPKLWHNLRATRQTELEESFPSHVVCRWIGNSETVARRHYLQVTEEHFAKAVTMPVQKTVHWAVQSAHETMRTDTNGDPDENEKHHVFQGFSQLCANVRTGKTIVNGPARAQAGNRASAKDALLSRGSAKSVKAE